MVTRQGISNGVEFPRDMLGVDRRVGSEEVVSEVTRNGGVTWLFGLGEVGLVEPTNGAGAVGETEQAGLGTSSLQLHEDGDDGRDHFEKVQGEAALELKGDRPSPSVA